MGTSTKLATFGGVVLQIVVLDMVFSIDSILTAFGLTKLIFVMVGAIVVAMIVMLWAAKPLSESLTNI